MLAPARRWANVRATVARGDKIREKRLSMQRRHVVGLLAGAAALAGSGGIARAADVRIALLVKNLGNRFFEACRDGAQAAAKELGGTEIIYTAPSAATAEGQIEIINSLIAQKVDAIAISANDTNALVPATKKAMQRGVKVISFDSGIAPDGRIVHINASSTPLIGAKQVQLMADAVGGKGEVAILSAASTMTNQNSWIAAMKEEWKKPNYVDMKLVGIAYGDDALDKSYRETQGLLKSYPNLKGIISPTSIGINAAAKAVADAGMIGKVYVTGLGLPSELKGHVDNGSIKSFAIWNPVDFGYIAVMVSYALVKGTAKGADGEVIAVGRLGERKVDPGAEITMSEPFTFDKSNIAEYAAKF
jgi:rhamnose transport system substrate-binding protein